MSKAGFARFKASARRVGKAQSWKGLANWRKKKGVSDVVLRVIDNERQPDKWLIHPQAQNKVLWDLYVAALIVYSTLTVPFRIGFNEEATGAMFVFDLIVDLSFATDMVLAFRTAYFDVHNTVVWDKWAIAKHYLRGQFFIDLVSTVPFDLIIGWASGDDPTESSLLRSTKLLRALRLIRLLRLMRLLKLGKFLSSASGTVQINQSLISLSRMIIQIAFIGHLLGCAWYWGAREADPPNWIDGVGLSPDSPLDLKYFTSLYWAFTTMTTVGYGDINASNDTERLLAILSMLVGASVFGYVVGNVTVLVENIDPQQALRKEKMESVKEFIRDRRLPPYLSRRVRNFYEYFYRRKSVFEEDTIVGNLPSVFRGQVSRCGHERFLADCKYLHSASGWVISGILLAMRPQMVEPWEIIFSQGDIGNDMFIVVSGEVVLLWAPPEELAQLRAPRHRVRPDIVRKLLDEGTIDEDTAAQLLQGKTVPVGSMIHEASDRHIRAEDADVPHEVSAASAAAQASAKVAPTSLAALSSVSSQKPPTADAAPVSEDGGTGESGTKGVPPATTVAGGAGGGAQTFSAAAAEVEDSKSGEVVAQPKFAKSGWDMIKAGVREAPDEFDLPVRDELLFSSPLQPGRIAENEVLVDLHEVAVYRTGDHFGFATVANNTPRDGTAVALAVVELYSVRKEDVTELWPESLEVLGRQAESLQSAIEELERMREVSDEDGGGESTGRPASLSFTGSDRPPGSPSGRAALAARLSKASNASDGGGNDQAAAERDRKTGVDESMAASPTLPGLRDTPHKVRLPPVDADAAAGGGPDSAAGAPLPATSPLPTTVPSGSVSTPTGAGDSEERSIAGGAEVAVAAPTYHPTTASKSADAEEKGISMGDLSPAATPEVSSLQRSTTGATLHSARSMVVSRRIEESRAQLHVDKTLWERIVIHPQSPGKVNWDLLLMFVILYSAVTVPYRIAFAQEATGGWAVFDLCTDIFFGLDILVNFVTGYMTDTGHVVRNRKKVPIHYLKGWFAIDFLSTFPFDLVVEEVVGKKEGDTFRLTKLLKMVRMVRLLKLTRFLKLDKLMVHLEGVLTVNPQVVKMIKLLVIMMFIAHINGCLWYGIAQPPTGFSDGDVVPDELRVWPTEYCVGYTDLDGKEWDGCLHTYGIGTHYLVSVYWAFTTMTTVGYGDVTAHKGNVGEMVLAMISMLVGTTVFAHVITSVMSMVVNFDPGERAAKQNLMNLADYLRNRNAPRKLRANIRIHTVWFMQVQSVLSQTPTVYDNMSAALRRQVMQYTYRDTLYQLPVLRRVEAQYPGFIASIALLLKPMMVEEGAIVSVYGDTARIMYFVLDGSVRLYDHQKNLIREVRGGSYFGESALWAEEAPAVYSAEWAASAATVSHLFTLAKLEFMGYEFGWVPEACRFLLERLAHGGNRAEWSCPLPPKEEDEEEEEEETPVPGAPGAPGGAPAPKKKVAKKKKKRKKAGKFG